MHVSNIKLSNKIRVYVLLAENNLCLMRLRNPREVVSKQREKKDKIKKKD